MEMTDMAFHENWYQFHPSIKRKFMLMILGNNLKCKLTTFEKFSISLPSFMTVRLRFIILTVLVYYLFTKNYY